MKKWTLKALEHIHRNGLTSVEWNIETERVQKRVYSLSYDPCDMMEPHIAIYETEDPTSDDVWLYNNCDYAITDESGHPIFIYNL